MSSPAVTPPSALALLADTAARALRCTVHVLPADRPPAPCDGAHDVPFAGTAGAGTLRFVPSPDAPPWGEAEEALADSFARLAGGLAERERHVDAVQALAAVGSFEWNVAQDRISWSAEQLRIHGLDASTHPRTFDDFIARVHPDDRAMVAALTEEGMRTGGRTETRYRIVRPDGEVRVLHARGEVTYDAAGALERVVGTSQDVTQLWSIERELRAANERLEQRVAERTAALRESEASFRRMIEHAHDLIVVMDDTGVTRYGSPSVRRILGYDPDVYANSSLVSFFHPDDAERVTTWLAGLTAQPGVTHRIEFRFRHADGHWVELEAVSSTGVDHPPGAPHVINVRDVTERRLAEAALRAGEEQFRALIERGNDLLMISGPPPDLALSYVSPSVEHLLGYTPEEMRGFTPADVLHPDDLARVYAGMCEIFAEPGTVRRIAWRIRHKDGSWRHYDAIGRTLDPSSAARGAVCNCRDVTEQRAAEEALQHSEEHFRRLIENGSDLLMISAPDSRLTYVSPSAERLLGWSPEEMLGCTPDDLVHPDDLPALNACMQALIEQPGTVHRVTWRIRHKQGGWRVIEAIGRTISLESADEGIVANGRDVTEQRAAEAALRQAKAEAEQARVEAERANVAKSEFLSRMSHELRTPLNSILGFAQVLEELELPAAYRGSVRHILNGGRHLLNLINEVLDIARIEADEQPLSIEPVRVGAVVREAMDMVSPLAAARGVRVSEAAHPSSDRHVRADRQRLTQVLLNLLSNAVKYNRPQGTVQIGCEPVLDASGEERLRVRVTDQGRGIPPAQRDQLFVPFARLGAEHSGIEGTGLGLALSQRLARAMGGALSLERTGEEGSVFCVDLQPAANPLASLPIVAARGDRGTPDAHGEATLLYIEDNLANLTLVETILMPRPAWRVIPALQGSLGLELAAEHAPDVVLLDLHLPDMHGRDVLRHLRADPRTAATPVVVISADATPKTVEGLLADGADAFLTKPLDVRAFLSTVERLIARVRRAG